MVRPRLQKAGADASDVLNYRPVSNLAFIAKVIERLVCRQLVAFFERLRLMPSVQSAYRSNHSTETAVLEVITDVLCASDRGVVVACCACLISTAFDTVDHDILIGRLQQSFGVNGLALSWMETFLRNRTQSATRSLLIYGVPQGSVLGPVLFLVYCADVIATTWTPSALICRRHSAIFPC